MSRLTEIAHLIVDLILVTFCLTVAIATGIVAVTTHHYNILFFTAFGLIAAGKLIYPYYKEIK